MKNWKGFAGLLGLDIPAPDLERILPALDALETSFRPIAGTIPHETEPALIFPCSPEESL